MKRSLLIAIISLLPFLSAAQAGNRKLLFIGIDGCRWDAIQFANTPNVDGLVEHSKFSSDGLTEYKTWSGTGWSNMLTGVWHTKHNVTNNDFANPNFTTYPDFISRIESANEALNTVSIVHWSPLNASIVQSIDHEVTVTTDVAVKDSTVYYLNTSNPDVLFVAFDDVDHAGHGVGFGVNFPDYVEAIETTDQYIGEILEALYARPNYTEEDWLIILTTDHGGNASGHGGGTLEERRIFNVFSNPAFIQEQVSATTLNNEVQQSTLSYSADAYAQPIDQSAFEFGTNQDFTIEMWVKAEVFDGDPALISNKDWGNGVNEGFVISGQNDLFWKVNIGDGQNRLDIQGGELDPNVWHHLAVSFDRDGLMTAYEDGVVVGFEYMTGIGDVNSGLPLLLHQDGTAGYNYTFNGSIRDVRIWNTVIPENVIVNYALNYITSEHPYYANLIANWRCDEGSGSVLFDSSAMNNYASVIGTASWSTAETVDLEVYDYTNTTRQPDNALTALKWMCIEIDPLWNLDGRAWLDDCVIDNVVENELRGAITVWPNPSNSSIQLWSDDNWSAFEEVQVKDMQGSLIFSKRSLANHDRIDVSNWSPGVYSIQGYVANAPFSRLVIITN